MLITSASFSAAAVITVGALVFWSNPKRSLNRIFFTFSLHLTAWLLCVHFGVSRHEDPFWVRMSSTVAAFVPAHMWLLKWIHIRGGAYRIRECVPGLLRWGFPGLVLAFACWTRWYVLPRPPGTWEPAHFGPAYFGYMLVEFTLFGLLCRQTVVQLRSLTGVSRLELQILLLGVTAAAFLIILLMALRVALHAFWPIHVQPITLFLVYSATLVAVTTHRIFDARQIALVALQKSVLAVVAVASAILVSFACQQFSLPAPFPLLAAVAVAFWTVATTDRQLQHRFQFFPEATTARRAVFIASQRDLRLDQLEQSFSAILQGWGHSERAMLFCGAKSSLRNAADGFRDGVILETMQQLHWATPERLMRERATPDRARVAEFMRAEQLGVIVLVEGPTLSALFGVGVSATRLPYTYPQVMQLLELGSIMEGALERVHFSSKAQHAEQLATIGLLGASVAHEIRNPLVTIKSFVQLLPAHYQDQRFRDKFFHLIGDEVTRIDRLTEQLLDLASPRAYAASRVELHPIVRATVELVAAKAAHKNVELVEELDARPDDVFTDAAAAKQVLLNLCFNAIQALEAKPEGGRQLRLASRRLEQSVEVVVADNGPGIAPEMRARLFEPFQTTKSTGFGLGLAICSDILSHLNATISVDPAEPGTGATFRVNFPCQPLSS